MSLLQSWRWYGPRDIVSLSDIEQAGAEGIVHALHHVPVGDVWTVDEIKKRQKLIEWDEEKSKPRNLKWAVVESLNVHEAIKKGTPERDQLIENYNISLKNLAECGIKIVCYNFMPLLDWTRTDVDYIFKDGSKALRYDAVGIAAFELFVLEREGAREEQSEELQKQAEEYYNSLSDAEKEKLNNAVLQGIPGSATVYSLDEFKSYLKEYDGVTREQLKENLKYFLEGVIPTAEKYGMKLCCHPDDPPYKIFGIPRIVSNEEDLKYLTECVDSPSNGITFCTGSLGPDESHDLPGIVRRLGHKFHFIHLRNVQREGNGSFHEADHLTGSVDMYAVMRELVNESNRRKKEGRDDYEFPFRPDHGHQMLDDLNKEIKFFGYSAIGRLRGLAELRGLELGIRRSLKVD